LDVLDLAEYLALRQILEVIQPHPRQIRTALPFLIATVEEAVVPLVETLMPLVKVDHLIVDLGLEVAQFLVGVGLCL
jgi:hypothetical protein